MQTAFDSENESATIPIVIAIGALGGSGTRAVAQILIEAGLYMGDDLNQPNDNLIFTRLFKNPLWHTKATKKEMAARLRIFNEYMENDKLSISNAIQLINASISNPTFHQNRKLILNLTKKILKKNIKRGHWGWKEPNTQIYVDEISGYFKKLKYIHIVRNGLDMAFSNNRQQLNNWGHIYGIELDGKESNDEIAYKQMSYWVKSTQDVLKKGNKLGKNFLLINHSLLYQNPIEHVRKIIQFSEINVTEEKLDELCKIPKKPTSSERYKHHNLSIFDEWQIEFARELGFEL